MRTMRRNVIVGSLLALIELCSYSAAAANLPFLKDDFAAARAMAIERKLPMFVECWAPW